MSSVGMGGHDVAVQPPAPLTPPLSLATQPPSVPSAPSCIGAPGPRPGHLKREPREGGPALQDWHAASVPAVSHQFGPNELLEVLVPRLVALALEAKYFLSVGSSLLSPGVQLASSGRGLSVRDVELEGKPYLPVLNTVLASALCCRSSSFNWTSVEVAFGTVESSAVRGRYVSSALLFSPVGETAATFHQRRPGHTVFKTLVTAIPFGFDARRLGGS